mmetsp:Transcript_108064/g.304415  ORF Transcript_108064/g.304415 Transcript_108064/m.304415 type:complete len:112 (+) Transcript_108064:73-408(+)
MAALRSRSGVLAAALVATVCVFAVRLACSAAFVSPPQTQANQLRGAEVSASAAAAAAMLAPAAAFANDEYINYRMAGEVESEDVIAYFATTIAFTFFAFASYFILTKLKII